MGPQRTLLHDIRMFREKASGQAASASHTTQQVPDGQRERDGRSPRRKGHDGSGVPLRTTQQEGEVDVHQLLQAPDGPRWRRGDEGTIDDALPGYTSDSGGSTGPGGPAPSFTGDEGGTTSHHDQDEVGRGSLVSSTTPLSSSTMARGRQARHASSR